MWDTLIKSKASGGLRDVTGRRECSCCAMALCARVYVWCMRVCACVKERESAGEDCNKDREEGGGEGETGLPAGIHLNHVWVLHTVAVLSMLKPKAPDCINWTCIAQSRVSHGCILLGTCAPLHKSEQ